MSKRKTQKKLESKEDEKELVADSKFISNPTYRGKGEPGKRRRRERLVADRGAGEEGECRGQRAKPNRQEDTTRVSGARMHIGRCLS